MGSWGSGRPLAPVLPPCPSPALPGFLPEHPFLSWGHTLHRHSLDYHSCVLDTGCCRGRWCGPMAPGGGPLQRCTGEATCQRPPSSEVRGPTGPGLSHARAPKPPSGLSGLASPWGPAVVRGTASVSVGLWGWRAVCWEASVLPQERGGALVTVVTAGAGTIPAFNCKQVSGSWGRRHMSRAHRTPQEAFVCSHPVSGPWGGRRFWSRCSWQPHPDTLPPRLALSSCHSFFFFF